MDLDALAPRDDTSCSGSKQCKFYIVYNFELEYEHDYGNKHGHDPNHELYETFYYSLEYFSFNNDVSIFRDFRRSGQ
ncbi:hypothetical protein PoHVEF18_003696 [Penicillium ochrochloron]